MDDEVSIEVEIKEILDETTKWSKLFESFCFKSKYIIEKQQNLIKKLNYENNITKNENIQLKSTNAKLVTRLRSRIQPSMSPGVSINGTHLVSSENYDEVKSPALPMTPGDPINSPIFPNLVQHNFEKETDVPMIPQSPFLENSSVEDIRTPNKSPVPFSGVNKVNDCVGRSASKDHPRTPDRIRSPLKSRKKGMTPKKTKRQLQLPPSSPDTKRMKQLKMDIFSPQKEARFSPAKTISRPRNQTQSPFKMPKSPKSRFFVRIDQKSTPPNETSGTLSWETENTLITKTEEM